MKQHILGMVCTKPVYPIYSDQCYKLTFWSLISLPDVFNIPLESHVDLLAFETIVSKQLDYQNLILEELINNFTEPIQWQSYWTVLKIITS